MNSEVDYKIADEMISAMIANVLVTSKDPKERWSYQRKVDALQRRAATLNISLLEEIEIRAAA